MTPDDRLYCFRQRTLALAEDTIVLAVTPKASAPGDHGSAYQHRPL